MRNRSLALFVLLVVCVISFTVSRSIYGKGIYGNKEPVESLYLYKPPGWRCASFSLYEHGIGVFVHVIGDSLSESEARKFYGQSLNDLDLQTREERIIYYKSTHNGNQILLISAADVPILQETLKMDRELQTVLDDIWEASEDDFVAAADITLARDRVWVASGHEPKLFQGLFTNPPYEELELFLQEDEQTALTKQVRELASLVNDRQDISTIKEIYNLIRAVVKNDRPEGIPIFESTASHILSQGIATGCTDYAIAFATLARAKKIPAVVIDSAKLDWIQGGCNLHYVWGHFFVEVYLDREWYLVDSTAGILYQYYDRHNWYLPSRYVAFTKALSVVDTGSTERSHNLLQRVAFLGKTVDYQDPGYPEIRVTDDKLQARFGSEVRHLRLTPDTRPLVWRRNGECFEIEASSVPIDFARIPIPTGEDFSSQLTVRDDSSDFDVRLAVLEQMAELLLQEIRELRESLQD